MDSKDTTASTALRDIQYAIRKMAGTFGLKSANFMTATVNSVDEANRNCEVGIVLGESNVTLTEVALSSEPNDGFILIPTVGTDVIICLMPDNTAYVLLCNDIDKIICVIDSNNNYVFDTNGFVWNNGNNAGLVKVIELTQKLNNLENWINQFIPIFNALTLPVSGSTAGPPSTPITNTLIPTNQSDIENTKIKH